MTRHHQLTPRGKLQWPSTQGNNESLPIRYQTSPCPLLLYSVPYAESIFQTEHLAFKARIKPERQNGRWKDRTSTQFSLIFKWSQCFFTLDACLLIQLKFILRGILSIKSNQALSERRGFWGSFLRASLKADSFSNLLAEPVIWWRELKSLKWLIIISRLPCQLVDLNKRVWKHLHASMCQC